MFLYILTMIEVSMAVHFSLQYWGNLKQEKKKKPGEEKAGEKMNSNLFTLLILLLLIHPINTTSTRTLLLSKCHVSYMK